MTFDDNVALLVIDVQRDFCAGGALYVHGADEVVPLINAAIPRYSVRVFTRDWHPIDHCSFSPAPTFSDGSWPVHCVQDEPGAEFHADLLIPPDAHVVSKGTRNDEEAYSAFDDTYLESWLDEQGIDTIHVCGLPTEFGVMKTVLDALQEGLRVTVLADACRGVDVPHGRSATAIVHMAQAGARISSTAEAQPSLDDG